MSEAVIIPVNFFKAEKGLTEHPGPSHSLCVLVGDTFISMAMLDTARNRFVGIGEFRRPAGKDDKDKPASHGLQALYGKIMKEFPALAKVGVSHLGLDGGKSTLVPSGMFAPGEAEHYISFNIQAEDDDSVWTDVLENPAGRNIYAMSRDIRDFAMNAFSPLQISHFYTALLRGIMAHPASGEPGKRLFVNFRDHFVDLVITDHHTLIFSNTFAWREAEDIVYYVIFVMEQFGMEPGASDVLLIGKVSPEDRVFGLLERYTRRPAFIAPAPGFHQGHVFDTIPYHRFFTLTNLPLCVS
jgi:hypothetical protein